jgi:hypothetical protein
MRIVFSGETLRVVHKVTTHEVHEEALGTTYD